MSCEDLLRLFVTFGYVEWDRGECQHCGGRVAPIIGYGEDGNALVIGMEESHHHDCPILEGRKLLGISDAEAQAAHVAKNKELWDAGR